MGVKEKRKEKNITQEELAYRIKVSIKTMYNIEKNNNTDIKTAFKIAKVLNTTVEELFDTEKKDTKK